MSTAFRPVRNSAKAIIIYNGRLLLQHNVNADGDWYGLPGGGQRHGETLEQALRRECREEIDAEVEVGPLRFVREYIGAHHEFAATDGQAHQVEFMFECRLVDPAYEPRNGGSPDGRQVGVVWVTLGDLPKLRLYPAALAERLVARPDAPASDGIYFGDVN